MEISIWLIIFIGIITIYFHWKKKKEFFVPFNLRIFPKWGVILKDFKLADSKAIDEILEKLEKEKEYDVLKNGINFTVLKSDEEIEIIYDYNRKDFHGEVNFREKINLIKTKNKDFSNFNPTSFYVKSGIEGYELGIITPESFKKSYMIGDDRECIKLTTIPYGLFYMRRYKFGILKPEQLKKFLEDNGWQKDEIHERYKKDVLFSTPEMLEHKYFTIYYQAI